MNWESHRRALLVLLDFTTDPQVLGFVFGVGAFFALVIGSFTFVPLGLLALYCFVYAKANG